MAVEVIRLNVEDAIHPLEVERNPPMGSLHVAFNGSARPEGYDRHAMRCADPYHARDFFVRFRESDGVGGCRGMKRLVPGMTLDVIR